MGQGIAKIKPIGGCNLDVSPDDLKNTQGRYLLNIERTINNKDTGHGSNEGLLTPVPANRLIPYEGWDGEGATTLRAFLAHKTNQTYVWVHKEDTNHCIYRINADLSIQTVYQGPELNFSSDPKYTIRGAWLFEANGKLFLVWVDGNTDNWQGFIDVETSIATNGFRVPYFQKDGFEQVQYIQLPTRRPFRCIMGEWIDIDPDDEIELSKENKMIDLTWQFRCKYIFTDGRETEWSNISSKYFVERSACQKDAKGLPRCLRLEIPAGHPQVEKIVIAFRNCNSNKWKEYLILDKYDACLDEVVNFWERQIREDTDEITFDSEKNIFLLEFCNDRECNPIDEKETDRTQNPCPINSFALGALEERLALINNIVGYNPIDCDEIKKITFDSDEGEENLCSEEFVNVKIAILIHNVHRSVNEFVFTYGNDIENEQKLFGGLMYRNNSTPFDNPAPYQQYFYGKQKGFIAYLEGAYDVYAISEQWRGKKSGANFTYENWGPQTGFDSGATRRRVSRWLNDGYFWIQYATLKVKKGTKGYVRLADHKSNQATTFHKTSTTVMGVFKNMSNYGSKIDITEGNTDVYSKEIYFEACTGDVDLTGTPFIVVDVTCPSGDLTTSLAGTAFSGYARDKNEAEVPRAQIDHYGNATGIMILPILGLIHGGSYDSYITDHNGFYFASWAARDGVHTFNPIGAKFYVEGATCTKQLGKKEDFRQGTMPNTLENRDILIDGVTDYATKYYTAIRLRVRDCRNAAVPGVYIAIKGAKAKQTNNSGVATLIVRNRMWEYGNIANYTEKVVVMQSSTCGFTLCGNDCNACMPAYTVTLDDCFSDVNGDPLEIDIMDGPNMAVVRVNPFFNLYKGLKTGGRYGFAPVFHDATGRHSFIPNEASYLDLPTIRQQNSFLFSTLSWQVSGAINLPPWVHYMSIYRTTNLAFESFLSFVIGGVEYIDSAGNEVPAAAADKIRLSIQCLLDYNDFYGFSTNTVYEFKKNDRISFIANEKGEIYDQALGNLDFLIEGNLINQEVSGTSAQPYSKLTIPNDDRLPELKPGTLIQIIRPRECETKQLFFEVCKTYRVKDNKFYDLDDHDFSTEITEAGIDTFDTYHVRRSIKYDENPDNDPPQPKKHSFPFPFEHHSPSDFWGDHCDDRGRPNTKNPYEKQIQYGDSGYLSNVLLENGNYNGLSTFSNDQVKKFKVGSRGDITYCHSLHRALKLLCERGNFISVVPDEYARIGQDGVIRAVPPDQILVEPNPNISLFGLQYEDVGALEFQEGFGMWIDSTEKAVVFDDYNSAKDISDDRIKSHLSGKLQFRDSYNATKQGFEKIRVMAGFDPVSKNVYFTFRGKNFADGFTSNRSTEDITKNETLSVSSIDQAVFFFSFTPECYGILKKSQQGSVFFAFKEGLPYVHKERSQTRFNEFFGVICDQKGIVSVNNDKDKSKQFLSMQVKSKFKFFVEKVETQLGQISEIPPRKFINEKNRYNASFLFDKLTPGVLPGPALYYGEHLRGYYALVSFVRDNTLNDSVLQTDDAKRVLYSELDCFYFLYSFDEQTAYNSNNK